jgi:hypothetical protein
MMMKGAHVGDELVNLINLLEIPLKGICPSFDVSVNLDLKPPIV